jgi:nitrogen fixation protein NifZ
MYEFEIGQEVRLLYDIVSDGTVYGAKRGDLMMQQGKTGFIIKIGVFQDDVVYEVNFLNDNRILGCRDHELIEIEEPWSEPKFLKKDKVRSTTDLTKDGTVIVKKDTDGVIVRLQFYPEIGYAYEVKFSDELSLMLRDTQIEKIIN